ncbi:ABC transporter permease [Chelatococcus asaccharovorans]|uniref:Putative ABC transport system permease protein n=1 Tax=Chelatococcus asaccharovorans TaxID=28210 RepID=A0A2V3UJC1_9HYPH|nr:ABC transporter permease [Chelatococcus asaccharovorans]MBS7706251.1 FtsX-like permease family protein [Chelatococcus asaccharovorans]PXW65113.1 putative ABC transport system permease protein [Chelatococcus asaccharovorans]
MAVALARKTLLHEWRRFLPAVMSVGFSGVLIIVQGALLLGIVGTNALPVTQSSADLWIGFPGTQSADLGRSIDAGVSAELLVDPRVVRVEPFLMGTGDWRGPRGGGISVTLLGIDTRPDGLGLAKALSPGTRALLEEPATVLVDAGDRDKLATAVGEAAEINGQRVRVVGTTNDMRAMGGVNVVASLATVRAIDKSLAAADNVTYYLVGLRSPEAATTVRNRFSQHENRTRFEVWTAADLAERSVRYWLLESGAGVGFIFATIVALLVGILITSQTLMAAVAASTPQYATLRAIGVSFPKLRRIVVEQAGWVGAVGLAFGLAGSLFAALLARLNGIPFALGPGIMVLSGGLVLAVALLAGLLALRRLRHADPAALLR